MEVREYMARLGKKGGSKGGKLSASRMTAKQRKERARRAGIASGLARKKKAKAKKGTA